MRFEFSEEQLALRRETIDFARRELGARLRERDRASEFSREDWDRCGARGVLGCHVPEEYGGQGLDAVSSVSVLEAVGYGCRDNGLSLALGGQIWSVQEPILIFGSEAQRAKYLPRLCAGEWIGAHAVTEETAGSDALSLQTTATRTAGGYLLNGRKTWIGMASLADVALVLANSDPEAGKWGISAFLVERGSEGLSQGVVHAKTGTRTNPLGDLVFENCFVPEENRLGAEGVGISLFTQTVCWERAFMHAGHVGSMQALFERCVDYAKERQQFGRSIGRFQSVSNRIAEMRLRLETSRLLMYKAAWMKDQSKEADLECAMANLQISESLLACATDAVRLFGARGYVEDHEVEREMRDSLGGVIYAGTSDIQRKVIASLLGL
jgi:alkylation response protein AidB-like acyl-CoA dehydrogenase